jgi:hypothetical protein
MKEIETDSNVMKYRIRQAELGRKPRQFYLTDQEFATMKRVLERIRSKSIEDDKGETSEKNEENQ